MNLIFIYGPPAVGKLTIASKLSERTGIALFHNHMTRDLVKSIYSENVLEHYSLVDTLRFEVLGYCARQGTDLIFTYVYEGPKDEENVRQLVRAVESNGGKVRFVELTAEREDLIARVGNESRKQFKKITDPAKLSAITEDMSLYSIPFVEALLVDTSVATPEECVEEIVQGLNL